MAGIRSMSVWIWILWGSLAGHSNGEEGILFRVRDFGAVGDARADDTEAFQRALDRAAETGGTVLVDPVEPGGGYVLTDTVVLPQGTTLMGSWAGMPFVAWEGVPREIQKGAVLLARPAPESYRGPLKRPLFRLEGGNTLRGLYILYDRQPWPSDEVLEDAGGPYRYETEEAFAERFVRDHVAPCGPTVWIRPGVASVTVEDITCGRYYDFLYAPLGGKIVIRRCYLFGYGRAFALREARDVVRISEIHIVPNVEAPISWKHARLHAAITSGPRNTAFDFGSVDGYSVSDVTVFLCHTGFKLGATKEAPFLDPITGEEAAFAWGQGPWGSLHNVKLDNCVVGFDCCLGTILTNQLTNGMVHVSIRTKDTVEVSGEAVARQAAFLARPLFAGATFQIQNLSISSFRPERVVASAAMVHEAGGRAFLLDCPSGLPKKDYAQRDEAHLEIMGCVASNIPETHLFGATEGTRSQVRIKGFVHNGVSRGDTTLRLAERKD